VLAQGDAGISPMEASYSILVARYGTCLLVAGFTAASAGEDTITVWTYGVGNNSCGDFVAASGSSTLGSCIRTRDAMMISENCHYMEFIKGYFSGLNEANAAVDRSQVKTFSETAGELWLRNYCNAHPLEKFYFATQKFYRALNSD
jgi:hypothetical protein